MPDGIMLPPMAAPGPRVFGVRADATPPAAADIKKLLEDSNTAFEAFKAANDERLAQIEKTGKALPETEAKVDKINAEITKLNTAIEDTMKAVGRLTAGGGGGSDTADVTAHARMFSIEMASHRDRPLGQATRGADAISVDQYVAYRDAFDQLIAANFNVDSLSADIRNTLTVGSDPGGGYAVPPERSAEFITRLFETSDMRSLATVRTIGREAWEQPKDVTEGVSGGWVAELDTRAKTGTPTLGMQRIPVYEQYAYPEISQTMLEDAVLINPEAWLDEKTTEKMVRTENTAFLTGNGVDKPRGFLDYGTDATTAEDTARAWGILQYVPTGAAGAFVAAPNGGDAMIDLVHKLKAAYRTGSAWMMARLTVAEVRKLKDGDSNYLWSMGNIQAGQPQSLLGYPIAEAEDMPQIAADSLSIAFGNFRAGYTIVDRLGLTVLRDPYTNKPLVGFYIRKRVGGDVTNFDAVKLLKFAAS